MFISFTFTGRKMSAVPDTVTVPYKTFLQITHANQVKMKLGSTEFHFRESQLETLRELVNRMTS